MEFRCILVTDIIARLRSGRPCSIVFGGNQPQRDPVLLSIKASHEDSSMIPKKFRNTCAACGAVGTEMNKEHFWPDWLINRTRSHQTSVRFTTTKRINPKRLVVPLCKRCNKDFGRELEHPVSRIFEDLEAGRGASELEAELLIRWLWKFEGLFWIYTHPEAQYTTKYTLRERVLQPIDDIRSELSLAISLIGEIDPSFGDSPMGLDSWNEYDATFVAGVFSRIAIMVLRSQFEDDVPGQFTIYRFSNQGDADQSVKTIYPKTGFRTCVDAVATTTQAAGYLSYAHDLVARNLTSRSGPAN